MTQQTNTPKPGQLTFERRERQFGPVWIVKAAGVPIGEFAPLVDAYKRHLRMDPTATIALWESAPDLLAALRTLAEHAQETYHHFESPRGQADIVAALAAIARAKGEA